MEFEDGFMLMLGVFCIWLATAIFNDVSVTQKELEDAVNKCNTNGGLSKYSVDNYSTSTAVCKNDAKFVYEYKEEKQDAN